MTRAIGRALLAVGLAACSPRAGFPAAPVMAAPTEPPFPGVTPDAPFRASAPQPDPRKAWTPPPIHESRLANGMRLLVVERHATPLVAARLLVRGGLAGFPSEPPAVVEMATDVAFHGSTARSEQEVYGTINKLFADAGTYATDDDVCARLRAATSSFDAGLVLLRDVVVTPSFANNVVDFERQRRLARLQKDGDDASRVALRLLYSAAYGPTHPYARARLSGADILPNVSRDDLVRTWKRAVDPADATLVVAGDVEPAALAARTESLFGAWKHDPSHASPADLPPPAPGPVRLVVVDRPGALQATIAYGATTAPASAPAHVASAVVTEMLGGMSSSALSQTLRDKLGATAFGAGSYAWKRGAGIAYWEGSVDRDRTADVLRALDARVRDLREHGPAQRELDNAKERFARSLPDGFETVGGMVEYLSQLPTYGFPLDEFTTREARVRGVTADAVRAATPPPEAMRAVVVGDLPGLRAQLASLGWGVIEEHDAAGALVRTLAR